MKVTKVPLKSDGRYRVSIDMSSGEAVRLFSEIEIHVGVKKAPKTPLEKLCVKLLEEVGERS